MLKSNFCFDCVIKCAKCKTKDVSACGTFDYIAVGDAL